MSIKFLYLQILKLDKDQKSAWYFNSVDGDLIRSVMY